MWYKELGELIRAKMLVEVCKDDSGILLKAYRTRMNLVIGVKEKVE